ncbi:NAD(P)-dependent alcohol dehydrogenase [uncultured Sphaerochaeta sp.]|uniref:NAD(P)-dependent alcohol dehydrogenase n=1 Tax=uncultured Sphaerochaeta sp. TaxID=886478 RepID=UPI002A0A3CC7|nr:NAD(P)-dependent alcohol dehydrogenase [uncultured Sphaerochaeta sp.]
MKKTMKAAMLYGPRDLRLEEVPIPEPKEHEVLLQILANGLCGSDIHFYEEGKLGPFVVDSPYIPGHEAVGRVVVSNTVGPKHPKGELVVLEPGIPCGHCEFCRSGRYNLCPDVVFLSAPPINGTFCEYVAIAADMVYTLPSTLSVEQGALAEPLSVGMQACRRAGLKAGQSVAVVGSGPIGLITALVARACGASPIIMLDIFDTRLQKAKELVADAVINSAKEDSVQAVTTYTNGRGVDVVFDTSGSSKANASTPFLSCRGGVITIVGWPEKASFEFPMEQVLEKELDIRGVNRYCNTYGPVLSLLASGLLQVDGLISHRFAFDQVCEAFAFATDNRQSVIKVVIA